MVNQQSVLNFDNDKPISITPQKHVSSESKQIYIRRNFARKPQNILKDPFDIRKEVDAFIQECNKNNDDYQYTIVQWEYNLTKKYGYLLVTRDYGSSSKHKESTMDYDRNNAEELVFKDELEDKKSDAKVPYHKELKHYRIRNTLLKNIRFFITPKAKQYVETYTKVRVENFLREFHSMQENYASEEYVEMMKELIALEKEKDSIDSYNGILWHIESAIRKKFDLGGRYSHMDLNVPLEYSAKSPNELYDMFVKYRQRLRELERAIKILENRIFWRANNGSE
jgi:hypothetical protein